MRYKYFEKSGIFSTNFRRHVYRTILCIKKEMFLLNVLKKLKLYNPVPEIDENIKYYIRRRIIRKKKKNINIFLNSNYVFFFFLLRFFFT